MGLIIFIPISIGSRWNITIFITIRAVIRSLEHGPEPARVASAHEIELKKVNDKKDKLEMEVRPSRGLVAHGRATRRRVRAR